MLQYRKHLLAYDAVFCASNDVKNRLNRIGIKNTAVTFNIADRPGKAIEAHFNPVPEIDRLKGKFRGIILFAAADLGDRAKGAYLIYDAAEKLPEYAFICVGRYGKKLERPNLIFTGRVTPDDLAYYYSISDIVAIPSVCPDALPRVGLEALAMSKPVVGSNCGGIPDIVEDGVNGLLFDNGDIDSLVGKIEEAFSDSKRLVMMGLKGMEKAGTLFSAHSVVDRVVQAYERILSNGKISCNGKTPGGL